MDCAGAGCLPFGFGAPAISPALTREAIDDICTEELMRRIVCKIIDDSLSVRPTLSGETGELTPCIDWLEARGFFLEAQRAMIYSRRYGGGGLVCIVDDGRPADQEVDILGIRDVVGFYALPKYNLIPDGTGSGRVACAWYGQRIGRPEHYYVTPNISMNADRTLAGSGEAALSYRDFTKIIARSGARFHRSRVIPWPYADELDIRQARMIPEWHGWGPGAVEGIFAAYMARRSGALRLAAIMNSIVVNTITMSNLEHRQSTPDMGAAVRARLEFIKACRDFMSDSVPLIATDTDNKFASLTHSVAGVDKVIGMQRQFLLDLSPYPAVVLFGDSAGGLNGGDRGGEWRAYASTVATTQATWVWQAGTFGGGMKQAVCLAMACGSGPTSGQIDRTVKPVWPSILQATDEDRASNRLRHAQARAQDMITIGLTGQAIARLDPTVLEAYPGLDVDESPFPVLGSPSVQAPQGVTAATAPGQPTPAATTPGAVNEALTEAPDGDAAAPLAAPAPAPAPDLIPTDINTEAEIAEALKMSRPALRKILERFGVRPYLVALPGQRGGSRYSLGEALAAFKRARAGAAGEAESGEEEGEAEGEAEGEDAGE